MSIKSYRYGLQKVVAYLPRFVYYVLRQFPSARFAMVVAAFGVILEYAALSVMLPLVSERGEAGVGSSMVVEAWRNIAAYIELPDQPQTWLWLFLLLLGLRIAVAFIQVTLNTWVSKRILSHLSGGAFSRVVMHEPLAEIYRRTVGHYTALAGDESVRVGQVFFYFAQTVSALISAAIGLAILLMFSPFVFGLTLLFLLLCAVFIGLTMKYVFSWSSESALLSREANTTFIEAFNGIRSIRSMAGEEFVALRYRSYITRYGRILFLLDVFNYGSRSIPGLILVTLGLIVLFPSARFVPEFSTVYFFTVTTMLIRVLSFLGTAISSGGRIAIDIKGAFDLDEIIEDHSARVEPVMAKKIVTSVGRISMSNLSCGYATGQPVLTCISGEFKAGNCYALVGQSGSGKSTLSDVLLGLLTPMAGELYIEDLPYDQIDLASLRHKVVLVEQQTRIFSGSVRENIAFGLEVTNAEVNAAVEAAGLSEFIDSLPKGLETLLDYQGANLSGGQRQRIGLARAIVRQPDVLLLDEATSALDGTTRDMVVQHLRRIFKDKILIFITHDNHVIQIVDEIWQIKKGKLKIEKRTALA